MYENEFTLTIQQSWYLPNVQILLRAIWPWMEASNFRVTLLMGAVGCGVILNWLPNSPAAGESTKEHPRSHLGALPSGSMTSLPESLRIAFVKWKKQKLGKKKGQSKSKSRIQFIAYVHCTSIIYCSLDYWVCGGFFSIYLVCFCFSAWIFAT